MSRFVDDFPAHYRTLVTLMGAEAGSTTVGIDHTYVSDLQITRRAPDGTEVLVIDHIDDDGNNFCQVVLDDAAATFIQTAVSAQAPFAGTWQPNSPLSAGHIEETCRKCHPRLRTIPPDYDPHPDHLRWERRSVFRWDYALLVTCAVGTFGAWCVGRVRGKTSHS